MAFLSAFTHLLFVFYHLVRKARLSQSYLHPHPQFSSYTDCRLADHQVSISCTVKDIANKNGCCSCYLRAGKDAMYWYLNVHVKMHESSSKEKPFCCMYFWGIYSMSVNYSVAGPYYNHPNPMSLTFNFKLIHEESLYVSYHSFILRDFTFCFFACII